MCFTTALPAEHSTPLRFMLSHLGCTSSVFFAILPKRERFVRLNLTCKLIAGRVAPALQSFWRFAIDELTKARKVK